MEVRDEFLSTRLVETAPGVVKLSNPRGSHDDIVTAVGMIVADLTERPDDSGARATVSRGRIARRATSGSIREASGVRRAGAPSAFPPPSSLPRAYGATIAGRGEGRAGR